MGSMNSKKAWEIFNIKLVPAVSQGKEEVKQQGKFKMIQASETAIQKILKLKVKIK